MKLEKSKCKLDIILEEETKRLIEKGEVVEELQGAEAENISPEDTLNWLKDYFAFSKEQKVNHILDKLEKDVNELKCLL
ncbi:hypothetical protein GKC33_11710 [Lactobacillus salivarius]|uniref:Uncharacterized protein n=1 Tax=Ligilactobacillus salivarius TaxID=1624 RepID=A0A6A8LSY8_9LACO|nr:hypothetical protein [Ligilactobacillus salivarius]MSE09321.1 hypothetical protein [Ligilactobacillus salivarius]